MELFDLDPNRLDTSWLNHPREYHQQAERLADAEDTFARAKAARDVVKAELDTAIRKDCTSFGLPKVTDEGVKNTIIVQARMQVAELAVLDAKNKMAHIAAIVDALEHKKEAMVNLVKLESRDYFNHGSPSTSFGVSKEHGITQTHRASAREVEEAFRSKRKSLGEGERGEE
jgi:hypothetical protein